MSRRVFVIGDLMVDCPIYESDVRSALCQPISRWRAGGTALLAAREFKRKGLKPSVFGGVGTDAQAEVISRYLEEIGIDGHLYRNRIKPTGQCHLFYGVSGQRWIFVGHENANDYDLNRLSEFLKNSNVAESDIVHICTHFLLKHSVDYCKRLMWLVRASGAKVVVDLVPHHLYLKTDIRTVCAALEPGMSMLIAEFQTLNGLISHKYNIESPRCEDWRRMFNLFDTRFLVLRFGVGDIGRQDVLIRDVSGQPYPLQVGLETGYSGAEKAWKLGFGDRLTAELLCLYGEEL